MGATLRDLVPTLPDGDDTDDAIDVTEGPPTPETPPTTMQVINSLLADGAPGGSRQQRLYRAPSGVPQTPKTRILCVIKRVPVRPMRKEVPWKKGKQQATNGEVKAFKPNVLLNCCKRKCCANFPVETPQVKKARMPLFDSALDRDSMRAALQTNAELLLAHPLDGKPVCSSAKALVYSCSRSLLRPQRDRYDGRTTGDSNRARAKTSVSVCAWFMERKRFSDIMPDTGYYQFSEPTRTFVKAQYDLDVETVKACPCNLSRHEPCECPGATPIYIACKNDYFFKLWDEHFPDVKTRKWCRFSKCTLCIQMRALRDTHRQNKYAQLFIHK